MKETPQQSDTLSYQRQLDKLRTDFRKMLPFLTRDDCTDICRNADGKTFVRFHPDHYQQVDGLDDLETELVIRSVAGILGKPVNATVPDLAGEFPLDGSRFQGVIPPLVARPSFAIRKAARRIIPLQHYITSGVMSVRMADAIRQAIRQRNNILVIGGTGSGKTTLANALLDEIARLAPQDRLVVLEDTPELCPQSDNHHAMRSSAQHPLAELLRVTLRLDPSRIVVGEVRGGEALALCNAWISGNPGGIATIHAGHCRSGLMRLEQLISEVSASRQPDLVGQAVDLTLYIDGSGKARRVKQAAWVRDWTPDAGYILDDLGEDENG